MHYPGQLREAFEVALVGHLYGGDTSPDRFFYDGTTQRLWDGMDTGGRLRWATG